MIRAEVAWQEVRKAVARRGSFWSAVSLTAAASLAALLIRYILWLAKDDVDTASGIAALDNQRIVVQLAVVLMIMVAAQVGSWDVANGTFRYLALTGEPRLALYLARVPAIVVLALMVLLPYWAIAMLAAFALPLDNGDAASAKDVLDFLWNGFISVTVWGLVAMGVGALLRSNGAAIAFGISLYLGGFVIAGLIALWSQDAAIVLLNIAVLRVAGRGADDFALAAAIPVVVAWTVVITLSGGVRTVRGEY